MSANGSSHIYADASDTELIVRDYFQEQFKRKGVVWPSNHANVNCASNGNANRNVNRLNANKRAKICESLCSMSSKLLSSFGPSIVDMCERLSLASPTTDATDNWSSIGYQSFKGVANELFGEGIKWAHILTLFVFSCELAFHHGVTKGHITIVDDVASWLRVYVNEHVLHWINDHGGWENFILYSSGDEPDCAAVPQEHWRLGKFVVVAGSLGLIGAVAAAGLLFVTKKLS